MTDIITIKKLLLLLLFICVCKKKHQFIVEYYSFDVLTFLGGMLFELFF